LRGEGLSYSKIQTLLGVSRPAIHRAIKSAGTKSPQNLNQKALSFPGVMGKRRSTKTNDFKRDLSSLDGVLKTIVAFSNTSGGIILLGVEDKSKLVRGIPDPLAVEERLANLISTDNQSTDFC
jgi:Putative DNA-binding domain